MKKLLLAIVVVMAISCQSNGFYNPTSDEKDFVLQCLIPEYPHYATGAHLKLHESEIKKTLIINETVKAGDLIAIFYSFSIGADVKRDVCCASMVDGKLYSVWIFSYDKDDAEKYNADPEELYRLEQKVKNWELTPKAVWAK